MRHECEQKEKDVKRYGYKYVGKVYTVNRITLDRESERVV